MLALYDDAVAWLAARGRSDQWGTLPFSARPDAVALIRARAGSGDMWLARDGDRLLGAIVLARRAPGYVPSAAGPELYVSGFITSRAPHARTVGRLLLDHARDTARGAGIDLLRLDCYAGGDGALVRYYECAGFTRVAEFTVDLMGGPYHACLLQQRLAG